MYTLVQARFGADLYQFRWQARRRGLFELPMWA